MNLKKENGVIDIDLNCLSVDLSLYKDESQIEKKTSGKRKANDKNDSAKKSTTSAKKRKTDTAKTQETPVKKLIAQNSKSAKVIYQFLPNVHQYSIDFVLIYISIAEITSKTDAGVDQATEY